MYDIFGRYVIYYEKRKSRRPQFALHSLSFDRRKVGKSGHGWADFIRRVTRYVVSIATQAYRHVSFTTTYKE